MIFEKVATIIAENRDMPVQQITMDTTFEQLKLDSLDTVDILMSLEEEFGMTIELDQEINCVADIVEIIEKAGA